MAAPTFFGIATNPADNGTLTEPQTTATITPPASMLKGDLVILRLYNESGIVDDGLSINNTGGQGWNSDIDNGSFSFGGVAAGHRIYWCTFTGTWVGGNPTFNLPALAGNRGGGAQLIVFRPDSTLKAWYLDTPPIWTPFAVPASPFTVTVAGITPSNTDTVTLAGWCSDDDNTWGTLAGTGWLKTGMATQYRNLGGSDLSTTYAYNLKAEPSATNNVSQNQATLGGDAGSTFILSWYATIPPVTRKLGMLGVG